MSHQRNRWTLAAEYLAGRTQVRGLPMAVAAETTTRCNLACPRCLRPRDAYEPMDMSPETFDAIWSGGDLAIEQVNVYGLGEPLCDSGVFEKIARATARGAAVQLSTNAALLDRQKARRLARSGVSCVVFSIDAVDPATYLRLRPGAELAQVVANIREFLAENERAPAPAFTIAQMVVSGANWREAAEFRRFWKAAGANAVRWKVDEVRPDEPAATPDRRSPCPVPWRGPFYVRADGSVFPCCQLHTDDPLGNVREQPLPALWNHPRMMELRARHAAGEGNRVAPCNRCFLPTAGRLVMAGAFLLDARMVRRLLPFAERWLFRGRLREWSAGGTA